MKTGGGDDSVNFASGMVNGDVTLKLGSGKNECIYGFGDQVIIGGSMTLITGTGQDLFGTSGSGMTVGKTLLVRLGDGADTISATVAISRSRAMIETGGGADQVSLIDSNGGSSNAALKLDLGAGDDVLTRIFPTTASAVFIGGAGTDTFSVAAFTAPVVSIIGFEIFT